MPAIEKDEKGLRFFKVTVRGKRFTVKQRVGVPSFYIRLRRQGKVHLLSTGTDVPAAAAKEAVRLITLILDGRWTDLDAVKLRCDYATVGQVCKVYELGEMTRHPKHSTGRLRKVVRLALGRDPEAVKVNEIDRDMWDRFVVRLKEEAKGRVERDPWAMKRWPTTHNSILGTVRGVFKDEARRLYKVKGLKVTDGNPFDGIKKEKEADFLPEALPAECVAKMDAAAALLKQTDVELWKCYILMRMAGMRNSEVLAMRWNWIERPRVDQAHILIVQRLDFDPKRTARAVPVDLDFIRELEEWRGDDLNAHVLQGASQWRREQLTERAICDFVRGFLPPGRRSQKVAYALRSHWGSEVAAKHGALVASRWLGHRQIQTSLDSYLAVGSGLEPVK